MDSLISAAARALAAGDPVAALGRVALRDDPPALALRGIAMAQLGEHARARELLRLAAKGFGPREAVARARCVVAEAEVALAMRDLGSAPRSLAQAAVELAAHGDHANALLAHLIDARRLLLLGRLDAAAAALPAADPDAVPPALTASLSLCRAELALRSLRIGAARDALDAAAEAAQRSRIPALAAEVATLRETFTRPAARQVRTGAERVLRLDEVATLLDNEALVVDGCRRGIGVAGTWRALARRPVLFELARLLAAAWPGDASRAALIAAVFRTRRPDDTHRARLRVEIGRLRALVAPFAHVEATANGFALRPRDGREVVLLAPPIDGDQAALLALLADGVSWSTSALALALGTSQRTVQRALAELEGEGRVRAVGQARARRWLAAPLAPFATILLLPAALPIG